MLSGTVLPITALLSFPLSGLRIDVKRVKHFAPENALLSRMFTSMEAGEEIWYIRMLPISMSYPSESGGEALWESESIGNRAQTAVSDLSVELGVLFEGMMSKQAWAPSLDAIICSTLSEGVMETSLVPLLVSGVKTKRWSAPEAVRAAKSMKNAMEIEISKSMTRKNKNDREKTTALKQMVVDLAKFISIEGEV